MSAAHWPAGPDSASAWTHIIRQLSVCSREMRRQLALAATALGVSDSEFLLLASLAASGPEGLAQTELAARVGLSAAQVSGLIERLQSGGWIELARARHDRRRHACHLTESGVRLVHDAWQRLASQAAAWDRQMPPAQREQLARWLAQLLETAAPERADASNAQRDSSEKTGKEAA